MITEVHYHELGVNRGAVLPSPLAYNGAMQTLVDFDDNTGIARYDDGQASVIILESPEYVVEADPEADPEADE